MAVVGAIGATWVVTVRRLRAAPGLLALVGLTVLIATVLVSTVPMYADAVDRVTVRSALERTDVAGRTAEISGRFDAADAATALQRFEEVGAGALPATPRSVAIAVTDQFRVGSSGGPASALASIDQPDQLFAVVEAIDDERRLDVAASTAVAAIDREAARQLDLSVGDDVALFRSGLEVSVTIGALIEPKDPADDLWLGSRPLRDPVVVSGEFTTYAPFWIDPSAVAQLATPVDVVGAVP